MNILQALQRLRDDIKSWTTNNIKALNKKIDEKTIPIDSELSSTSVNPVQNKVIANEINSINERVGDTPVATQISRAIQAQEYFSGDYNDLVNAPDIFEDASGNMIIADESGNIIFKADANGVHTTAISLNGEVAATEKYVNDAIANIDIPEVDFTGYATEDFVETAINTAKEELSESIVSESNEWKVIDSDGNIIFSVDAEGAHTTELTLNGESVTDIVDKRVASLVDSAPDTLNTLNELAAALGDDPNFATTVATEIGKKVDKVDGKGLSTNDFTNAYKEKLDGLENITFEESDPTVPAWAKEASKPSYTASEVGALSDTTVLADLTDDAMHRTVTDAEKASWNAKSEFSGDYSDLTNAPDITEDGAGDLVIADPNGNVILRSNNSGFETVNLFVQSITINGETIQDIVRACVEEVILGGEW